MKRLIINESVCYIIGCLWLALPVSGRGQVVKSNAGAFISGTNMEIEVVLTTNNTIASANQILMELSKAVLTTDESGMQQVEPTYKTSMVNAINRIKRAMDEKELNTALYTVNQLFAYPASAQFRIRAKELQQVLNFLVKNKQSTDVDEAKMLTTNLFAIIIKTTTQEELQVVYDRIQQIMNNLSRTTDSGMFPSISTMRNNLSAAQNIVREWMIFQNAESSGDKIKAIESLNRISSMSSSQSPRVNKDLNAKIKSLNLEINQEMEKFIKTTREALVKTTTSKELQSLSSDFNREADRFRRSSYNDTIMQQLIDGTRNFLSLWVRVVAAEEKGDTAMALQSLSNAENDYNVRFDVMFQTVVAEKRNVLIKKLFDQPLVNQEDPLIKMVDEKVAKADSIDKLVDLKRLLQPLQNYTTYSSRSVATGQTEIQALISDITFLESAKLALQSRQWSIFLPTSQYPSFPQYSSLSQHRWKSIVNAYQNQLRGKAISEIFELKDFVINEGQTLDQALLKVADKAVIEKQWELLGKCLDAYRVMIYGTQTPPAYLMEEMNACRNFIAAQNFVKAGDIERAVASYMAVLHTSSNRSPVSEALKEIASIRAKDPSIFEKIRSIPVVSPPASQIIGK